MMTEEQMDQFEYDMLMADDNLIKENTMTKKEYTFAEYEQYYKWVIERVKNIMENSDELEEQYEFSKIYHTLNDIHSGFKILQKKYEEDLMKELNKTEYTVDDFKEYYKAPAKYIRIMRSMYADDKDLVHFCDMVLDDLECVDSISQVLKGKYDARKN